MWYLFCYSVHKNKNFAKGHSFLVWYFIDREDQESESGFLCKKYFFVEKTVLIQSALRDNLIKPKIIICPGVAAVKNSVCNTK